MNLFIVTGTSGAGKTTVIPELRKRLSDYVVYDGDSVAVEDYNISKCNWLRIARSNYQSGIKTIVCSTIVPENLLECDHVQHFDNIYYINLKISDDKIILRLSDRKWSSEMIDNYVNFSHWLSGNAETAFDPPMFNIECDLKTPSEVADEIIEYIKSIEN